MNSPAKEPKLTTERLNEMAFAFKKTGTLLGALDVDIFTAISRGATRISEIAEATNMSLETAERLVIACHALDLVCKEGDSYRNTPDVEKFLVKDQPTFFGDYLIYQARHEYDLWKDIGPVLKPRKGYYYIAQDDPEAARRFTQAGYNSSISLAHKLAREFDFSRFSLLADLGGGSGCYSIAACLRYPNLRAIVFDFPNVVAVAREYIEMHGLSDRIQTHPGDFIEDELPQGADLMSFITPLQSYGPERIVWLAQKVYRSLSPGGTILIIEYMLKDDKSGPLDPALMNLTQMLRQESEGRVNSGPEFRDYLTQTGFRDIEVRWLLPHMLGLVTGRKPG